VTFQPISSTEPIYVHDQRSPFPPLRVRPDMDGAAYSVEEDVQGGLVVIETESLLIMGVFRRDMREFAEDMRDRLIIRKLAQEAS
jgi:hypothetical protein